SERRRVCLAQHNCSERTQRLHNCSVVSRNCVPEGLETADRGQPSDIDVVFYADGDPIEWQARSRSNLTPPPRCLSPHLLLIDGHKGFEQVIVFSDTVEVSVDHLARREYTVMHAFNEFDRCEIKR